MVKQPRSIMRTPFKATDVRVLDVTNRRIRGLVGKAQMAKRQINLKNLRDRIEARGLPNVRPGAIE